MMGVFELTGIRLAKPERGVKSDADLVYLGSVSILRQCTLAHGLIICRCWMEIIVWLDVRGDV